MTQNVRMVFTEIDVDAVGDDWTALVDAGIAVREAHDGNRWTLGDLAKKCVRRYKNAAIKKYAADVGVRSSTMYEYLACATLYSLEDRVAYPPLTWSHYRAAEKLDEHDLAMEWLARAADEGWSADTLTKEIKRFLGEDTPEKVYDAVRTINTDDDGETPLLLFNPGDVMNGKKYRVVLYEIEGEMYEEDESEP